MYSRERLRALADEWYGLYPNLIHLTSLLKQRKQVFFINEISETELVDNYLEILVSGRGEDGLDLQQMKMAFDGNIWNADYRLNIALIFYKVGLVGIKPDPLIVFLGVIQVLPAFLRQS